MSGVRWVVCLVLLAAHGRASAQSAARKEQVEACAQAAYDGQDDLRYARLLQARTKLVACASDACPLDVREDCARWLKDAQELLPSLTVRVVDPTGLDVTEATISVDETVVPLNGHWIELDPGLHKIHVTAAGEAPGSHESQDVVVVAGEQGRVVTIALQAQPAAAAAAAAPAALTDSRLIVPAPAWLLGAVGLAALGSFATFGILSSNEHAALQDSCAPQCSDAQLQSGQRYALVADISLVGGIAALAGGALWTVFSQKASIVPVRGGVAAVVTTRF